MQIITLSLTAKKLKSMEPESLDDVDDNVNDNADDNVDDDAEKEEEIDENDSSSSLSILFGFKIYINSIRFFIFSKKL